MFKVFITDKLDERGVAVFRREPDFGVDVHPTLGPGELLKVLGGYDAVVLRSSTVLTREILEAAPRLKVVARAGTGLDNVDVEAATRLGVVVLSAPDGNTIAAAEHTVALALSLVRNIPQAYVSLKEKRWERARFTGVELYGKTLGVVGLGRIGFEVARRLGAFGMRVLAHDPGCPPARALAAGAELVGLEELLRTCDLVTVHVPKTRDTENLIGEAQLALCRPGVRFVNAARGGIIDEAALARAVREGRVAGAAVDVFVEEPPVGSPLLELDRVVVTPHLGASTEEAQGNVAEIVARRVVDALRGRSIAHAANVPPLVGLRGDGPGA